MTETIHGVCAIVLLCLVLVGCSGAGESTAPSAEGETMKAAIYVEETLSVGTDTYIDSMSPIGRYGVVFEDDTQTGYFYALDMDNEGAPIVEALHIYNVDSIVDKNIPSTVHIMWSADGMKSMLLINDYPHAIFDFEVKRGYCRSGFPPPNTEWTQYDNEWNDAALELFE